MNTTMALPHSSGQSDTNDTSARFWTRLSRKYASQPVRDQAAYEKTLSRTVEHLGPDDKVLELGCGTGSTALLLAGGVGSYLATDFSEGMIGIAKEKLSGSGVANLSFLTADAFDKRLETETGYDAVLAYNFLHLVADTEAVLARSRALLKPGGLLITKTVCLGGKAWLFRPMIAVLRLVGKAPYVRMLTVAKLEDLIGQAGFEIIETGTYPASPPARFVVARKI